MVANISLILPFGLAVAICYIAFNSMIHEIDAARAQSVAMGSERTEIIKALVAQNSKLAEAQAAKAGSTDVSLKGLNDLLLAVLKTRTGEVGGGQPPIIPPVPGK
ncbi:hypothetical protein MEX01_38340 [Methylorubrum extorquens]|uniref:hypothetical protein n=1 Tax=Methylorubrum extorquens TaxID=408 RepID=UPI00116D39B1|nr:hypothetical protein [Methylorubrum extorquens]GEL43243.1 hypothetical protein MEX01_38340 [Methylorubrum extorquens]